jgi:hypothetical protein
MKAAMMMNEVVQESVLRLLETDKSATQTPRLGNAASRQSLPQRVEVQLRFPLYPFGIVS